MAVPVKKPVVSSDGWEDAPTTLTRKVVHMDITGPTGSGRTALALTAPGPVALCHAAEKIDGLVQAVRKTKELKLLNFGGVFGGTEENVSKQADIPWTKLTKGWNSAMDGWAKSLIMDTASEGWELLRLASFGTVTPKGRTDNLYGKVNAEWRSLYKRFRMQEKCNVISIHQVKDEYLDKMVNGQKTSIKTGKDLRAGMREMGYMADVVVWTGRDGSDFVATITKGWYNAVVEGAEFRNEDITFANIMSLITGDDPSVWGG